MNPLSVIQRAIAGGLMVALLLALAWGGRVNHLRAGYKANLAAERAGRAADQALASAAAASAEAGFIKAQVNAAASYADRLAAREPVILRSTDTVREYANSAAGRVLCRDADRLRAIDALDRELAPDPGPAGGGDRAVQPDAPAPAG